MHAQETLDNFFSIVETFKVCLTNQNRTITEGLSLERTFGNHHLLVKTTTGFCSSVWFLQFRKPF